MRSFTVASSSDARPFQLGERLGQLLVGRNEIRRALSVTRAFNSALVRRNLHPH